MLGSGDSLRRSAAPLAFVLLFIAAWFALEPTSRDHAPRPNPAQLEARAIRAGGLALPERLHDTAVSGGRVYNVFQPGLTLVYLVLEQLHDPRGAAIPLLVFALFVLTTAVLYRTLLMLTEGRRLLSFALTASMMFGAPYLANLKPAMAGAPWRLNQCFAVFFVVASLWAVARGRESRMLLIAGLFIGAAMVFRAQLILLLTLPLLLMLRDPREARSPGPLFFFPALAILMVLGVQAARFGSPFETGYMLLYEGRSDDLALRAARYGLFSWHFLWENLNRTLLAIPWPRFENGVFVGLALDDRGNSLLVSQPILLLGLAAWRRPRRGHLKIYVAVSALMALPVLLHHNPGWYAPGYMRLALDYLPVWIAAAAVALGPSSSRWTPWLAIVLAAFALAYGWYIL